ncbi:hypothetical protein HRbin12_00531 [bacterium HR12]|nr:hypothetical protein HRbin12_00531 [bacterium HR12]
MRRRPIELRSRVGYHDLLADLRHPGCPACRAANRAAWRYLDALLWELVNDPETRARLRDNLGFCRTHAFMALSVASRQGASLGMAIIYEDLLGRAAEQVRAAAAPRRRGRRALPHPPRRCAACESADQAAANALAVLAAAEEGSEPWRGIRQPGRGLCLPHVSLGLRLHPDETESARLAEAYLRGEAELRAALRELIRKHDYRFREEGITDEERASWVRAVHLIVGEPTPRTPPSR